MAVIVGADGYKSRWLAIALDTATGRLSASLATTAELPALRFDVLAIDIPIGLADAGAREADRDARTFVGRQRLSSIFPAPILPALECSTRGEASDTTYRACGKRVSAQGFALFSKVLAVRQLLRAQPDLTLRVYEVHPEVSFRALSGKPLAHYKKTVPGMQERQELIAAHFGAEVFDRLKASCDVRLPNDDLADAFAALWSAGRILEGTVATLPPLRLTDSTGLPLNIWY
jgi:predicted RNase H-like nuclease